LQLAPPSLYYTMFILVYGQPVLYPGNTLLLFTLLYNVLSLFAVLRWLLWPLVVGQSL